MTREEAIRRLRYIRMDYLGYPPFLEPIDMAIEALTADTEEVVLHKILEKGMIELPQEYVSVVRCKDCRWYRDTFLDTKITPTCDRHIDDRYGTLVGGITGESFCSYGERREPLPQYEEWQDEFNKMCESARPTTFVADEWYIENFGENNGK